MNKKDIIAAAVVILLFLPSCFNTSQSLPEVKLREFAAGDDAPALNLAIEFTDGFVKSLRTGEFSHWQRQLPPHSAAKIGEKEFLAMRQELQTFFGELENASYFVDLTTGDLRNYLWKLSFKKEINGKETVNEVIFFVRIFCEEGKSPAISGFGVKKF